MTGIEVQCPMIAKFSSAGSRLRASRGNPTTGGSDSGPVSGLKASTLTHVMLWTVGTDTLFE